MRVCEDQLMERYLAAFPLFIPAFALGVLMVVAVSRVGARKLSEPRWTVAAWLTCTAFVLALTLTPSQSGLERFLTDDDTIQRRVWAWSLPNIWAVTTVNWQLMNLLMFLPLGLTSGLFVAAAHRWSALVVAMSLSFLVEVGQYAIMALGRSVFSFATVIIGWCGILAGFGLAALIRWALSRRTLPATPRPSHTPRSR